jgi:hypothetical protein
VVCGDASIVLLLCQAQNLRGTLLGMHLRDNRVE